MDLDGFALLRDLGFQVLGVDLAVRQNELFLEAREVALELGDLGAQGQVLEREFLGVANAWESAQAASLFFVYGLLIVCGCIRASQSERGMQRKQR